MVSLAKPALNIYQKGSVYTDPLINLPVEDATSFRKAAVDTTDKAVRSRDILKDSMWDIAGYIGIIAAGIFLAATGAGTGVGIALILYSLIKITELVVKIIRRDNQDDIVNSAVDHKLTLALTDAQVRRQEALEAEEREALPALRQFGSAKPRETLHRQPNALAVGAAAPAEQPVRTRRAAV